jgi:CRP-like cAMP-binding protein
MREMAPAEVDLLKGIQLFAGLPAADLARVSLAARRQTVETGSYLFFEADPAEVVYALLKGRIKLSQVTPEGQQVILHYVTPGDAFGVVAVLSEVQYPVSAQAVEDSQVLSWDRAAMRELMTQIPRIAINSVQILAGRVRDFQDRVRELSTERVERRIARALIRLARQTGKKVREGVLIDLPLSRQDLAEMSGTTLFTVSRTLSQWESKGLIQSGRERVVIRIPHGLVSIAEDLPPGKMAPPEDDQG